MKRKKKPVRDRKITIRLSPDEHQKLNTDFEASTCRIFSEYIRDRLNKKPLTVFIRNQSLDEFTTVALGLKKELNACGKTVNEAVRQLFLLQQAGMFQDNLEVYQAEQFDLLQKIEQIKSIFIKIYELWSQK